MTFRPSILRLCSRFSLQRSISSRFPPLTFLFHSKSLSTFTQSHLHGSSSTSVFLTSTRELSVYKSRPKILTSEEMQEAAPAVAGLARVFFKSQALYTVTRLKVPDVIGDGALTIDEIVAGLQEDSNKINKDALNRCMRYLAVDGIFDVTAELNENGQNVPRYSLTTVGAALQTTGPPEQDMACGVLHTSEPPMVMASLKIYDFVAGKTEYSSPWEAAHGGKGIFDYYKEHPESAEPFNKFMTSLSAGAFAAVVHGIPWEDYSGKKVMDVGGGHGLVASKVKESFPNVELYSMDQPDVIEESKELGKVPDGIELVAGNFFDPKTFPDNLDAIFMKHILHDWSDEACIQILKACHKALPSPKGKVYVFDAILPDPGEEDDMAAPKYGMDILMMTISGKERTKTQWKELANAAGFEVESFHFDIPNPVIKMTTLVKK